MILIIYGLMLLAILDTMRIHGVFKEKNIQKSINLYLVYLMLFMVCIGRYISVISIFCAVKNDNTYAYQKYNYGFWTATFAIILVSISQINSINMATLRTRYVNRLSTGLQSSTT